VRNIRGLKIVQPDDRDRYAVIGAFRLPGQTTIEQAREVQKRFVERHGVLVVAKAGLASGPVMRVTPALFNTLEDLNRLVGAIRAERSVFI
jgi:selenocysteine lyase/cysteine desulfurase